MEALNAILFLPLLSALVIVLFFRTSKWGGATVSVISALVCAVFALYLLFGNSVMIKSSYELFRLGDFSLNIGLLLDSIGANMIFVVCIVGFLIHVFSVGYMDTDDSKGRFFAGLSFFMFSMTGIVFASNLFMMFVFWELVGFSSYALIAHYADTQAAREASKKAFIVNRVGDFGFLLGIIFCWSIFGTTDFIELAQIMSDNSKASTLMGLLIMCGFIGKSAQLPLQVWLSDAMAGPTPVSALIHAATMVAAGVFMMVRLASINFLTVDVLNIVMILGSLMAFMAGLWALGQNDIKKILAYSTLAHLGMMGAAIGLGYGLAMFHLTTHAFFKATLFLVAGSIIHACHHEQDIFKMGGLFKRMPVTSIVALIATLSIIATPMFSGYFSKESILTTSFVYAMRDGSILLKTVFCLLLGAAFMTPIYMGRLFFNVFFGKSNSENALHAKESCLFMTIPLAILAVLSLAGGWSYVYDLNWLAGKMNGLIPTSACTFVGDFMKENMKWLEGVSSVHTFEYVALAITITGVVISYVIYGKCNGGDTIQKTLPFVYNVLNKHGWFDDFYNWYVVKVQQRIAVFMATFVDLFIVELMSVRGIGVVCAVIGQGFKRLHDCSVNSQVKWFVFGVIFVFVLVIFA